MPTPIRIALVGAGYWGSKFIPELIDLHNEGAIKFVGLADPDQTRHRPPLKSVTDHLEIIEGADAAIIATPNDLHVPIALEWIRRHKHVLVEKPIATNYEDAQVLLHHAVSFGVKVMPGHLYRFSRLIQAIKDQIVLGVLGEVIGVNIRWITPIVPKRDLMFDLMPHVLDIIYYLFGSMPKPVCAVPNSFGTPHLRQITLQYSLENGPFIQVEIGRWLPEKHRSLEIVGTEKWLSTDVVKDFQNFYLTDPETGARTEHWVPPNNTIQDEIREFLRYIRDGKNDMLKAAVAGISIIERSAGAFER